MATKAQEEAVRRYLEYVKDPASIVDASQVEKLEARLAEATDPVERLTLRGHLEAAREGNGEAVREGFGAHAKAWADDKGVTASAFEAEGVPRDVLADAGLVSKRGGRRRPRNRVSAEDVRKALPRRKTQQVTVNSLAEETGASVGTVRNVIKEEVEAGRLAEAGPDPGHAGPGRAPTVYVKA